MLLTNDDYLSIAGKHPIALEKKKKRSALVQLPPKPKYGDTPEPPTTDSCEYVHASRCCWYHSRWSPLGSGASNPTTQMENTKPRQLDAEKDKELEKEEVIIEVIKPNCEEKQLKCFTVSEWRSFDNFRFAWRTTFPKKLLTKFGSN